MNSEKLNKISLDTFNEKPNKIIKVSEPLLGGQIFRLEFNTFKIHAVSGISKKELDALDVMYKHFINYDIPLAKVHYINPDEGIIFQEYLTTITLLDVVQKTRGVEVQFKETVEIYKKLIKHLVVMQIDAGIPLIKQVGQEVIHYSEDKIFLDLVYFLDYYLPNSNVKYDREKLKNEAQTFSKYLASFGQNYFYYRDLMTRNILLKESKPYFLDYQGGRAGFIGVISAPLAPSITSLLNHTRANLPRKIREELLSFYISEVKSREKLDEKKFYESYKAYSILKNLQNLGTYAYYGYSKNVAGYDGGKAKFLDNIPNVLNELKIEIENYSFSQDLSYFSKICFELVSVD